MYQVNVNLAFLSQVPYESSFVRKLGGGLAVATHRGVDKLALVHYLSFD